MMDNLSKHIAGLIYRHLAGTITTAETEELQAWSKVSPDNDRFLTELSDETDLAELILFNETYERNDIKSSLYDTIHAQIITTPVRALPRHRWWAAAAIIMLLAIGATYMWTTHKKPKELPPIAQHTKDIAPGKDGAILTLADGSQISLDTVKNATIATQNGVTAKVVNGTLLYEGKGNELVYNTMSTPKGRQYHLTLPDGTNVWLNSQSSIHYPTRFSGNERKVNIEGEAYFEVARNSAMPFKVVIGDKATVNVLGTAFNVNAYDNEPQIATTLVEGSIKIAEEKSPAAPVILQPGQQARVAQSQQNASGIEVLLHPDMEKALAWKNGQFYFDGATLPEIMRQVERWYDIQVVLPGTIPHIVFEGKMTRGVSLRFLLHSMEDLGVHYRLEGKVLTIVP
jgi:ferric-dicitrate binding protein FerR (iron transport regulator)